METLIYWYHLEILLLQLFSRESSLLIPILCNHRLVGVRN